MHVVFSSMLLILIFFLSSFNTKCVRSIAPLWGIKRIYSMMALYLFTMFCYYSLRVLLINIQATRKESVTNAFIQEVEEYFTNYIVNDSLGIIANAHTAFADSQIEKAMSGPCIELAKLFSVAVDFPKTGVPAIIPSNLFVKEYPDFMEKHDKPTYTSINVIGKLFRDVKDISLDSGSIQSFTSEVARKSYDCDMEVDGFENYVEDAIYHKENYDRKLGDLLDYYGIKTEAEILSGSIMKYSRSFTKRRDSEAIMMAVRSLRKEARSWFNETEDDVYAKASAWYHVTYHPDYCGYYNDGLKRDHYLSFAWCIYDKLIHIKRERQSLRKTFHFSSLEDQLSSIMI